MPFAPGPDIALSSLTLAMLEGLAHKDCTVPWALQVGRLREFFRAATIEDMI